MQSTKCKGRITQNKKTTRYGDVVFWFNFTQSEVIFDALVLTFMYFNAKVQLDVEAVL